MSKTEQKQKAQQLIMNHLSIIGYGNPIDDYIKETGDNDLSVLFSQMSRIAKLFNIDHAWFS